MKVLGTEGLLCNIEILDHLQESKASNSFTNLQTIVVEIQAYLRERPAGNPEAPQSLDNVAAFVRELSNHKLFLEKAEIIQIVNSAPSSMPVLFCLIEEADIRFDESQLETILSLSERYLGFEPLPGVEQDTGLD